MASCEFGINPPLLTSSGALLNASWHSAHEGGAFFLLGDGAVRFISENLQNTGRCWNPGVHMETPSCATWPGPWDTDPNRAVQLGTFQRLGGRNDGLPVGEF
jgi:hypothetical protein